MCTNRESSLDSLSDFDACFAADLAATRAERRETDELVVLLGFDTFAAFVFRVIP
jgi:hypothetical protein